MTSWKPPGHCWWERCYCPSRGHDMWVDMAQRRFLLMDVLTCTVLSCLGMRKCMNTDLEYNCTWEGCALSPGQTAFRQTTDERGRAFSWALGCIKEHVCCMQPLITFSYGDQVWLTVFSHYRLPPWALEYHVADAQQWVGHKVFGRWSLDHRNTLTLHMS